MRENNIKFKENLYNKEIKYYLVVGKPIPIKEEEVNVGKEIPSTKLRKGKLGG